MSGPRATLGGFPLLATQRIAWAHTAGVRPYQRTFEVTTDQATALLGMGVVTLEINDYKNEQLYVISSAPGRFPFTKQILVSDRRWLWARKWFNREYNIRRRTGETRLVGEGRMETKQLVLDVAYQPWTLNGGRAWSATEMLLDVLGEIEFGNFDVAGGVKREVEIEDLVFNEPGDAAVERALSYLGGYQITVDPNGRVRVYDERDGAEKEMVRAAGAPVVGAGLTVEAERSLSRPASVIVHFERECELRFDYEEGAEITEIRDRPERKLENVIPCPDPTLDVDGQTVTQGTWIPIDDFFDAVASEVPSGMRTWGHDFIREIYLGAWEGTVIAYQVASDGGEDVLWLKRQSATRKHWRLTFRVLRPWLDQIRSLRAYRVALLDQENGTRAPSEAFMDYVAKPSMNGLAKTINQNTDIGRQVDGWAERLADGKIAPARVTVIDEEAGIIRVDLVADPWGEAEMLAPGNVEVLPTQVPQEEKFAGAGKVYCEWAHAELEEEFKVAIVLTATQASPNSIGRYHRETVTAAEAGVILKRDVGPSLGPTMHIFISGGVQTARFAWVDDRAAEIDEAFFSGGSIGTDLMVNHQEIRALALAAAAREYAVMLDRVEGSFAVKQNPGLKIVGALSAIEHALNTDGSALTYLILTPDLEPMRLEAALPATVQRTVRRMVQP